MSERGQQHGNNQKKVSGISAVAGASMLVPWKFAVREAWASTV